MPAFYVEGGRQSERENKARKRRHSLSASLGRFPLTGFALSTPPLTDCWTLWGVVSGRCAPITSQPESPETKQPLPQISPSGSHAQSRLSEACSFKQQLHDLKSGILSGPQFSAL